MATSLPPNVVLCQNAAFSAKLAEIRDQSLSPLSVRAKVAEAASILAAEVKIEAGVAETIAIIVVLRSGLAMFEPFVSQISPKIKTVTFHLGIFRDSATLQPVEYYNKLPRKPDNISRAYVVDPLIATGNTASAVINILKDWGISHITFLSLLSSRVGVDAIAAVWPEHTSFLIGAVDNGLNAKGYVTPGLGDIGDRLFGTDLK